MAIEQPKYEVVQKLDDIEVRTNEILLELESPLPPTSVLKPE